MFLSSSYTLHLTETYNKTHQNMWFPLSTITAGFSKIKPLFNLYDVKIFLDMEYFPDLEGRISIQCHFWLLVIADSSVPAAVSCCL